MLTIGIIGDYNEEFFPHTAINVSLDMAYQTLNQPLQYNWIDTENIEDEWEKLIANYHAFWIAPGSPYHSMESVLKLIQYARESNIPVLGTCGGFQHMVIEFARNVLGIKEAAHAEYDPYASRMVVQPLSCSLKGQTMPVNIVSRGSLAYAIYNASQVKERYYCDFGLNPAYQQAIDEAGLRIAGTDNLDEVRMLELDKHPFYIATLFVPQANPDYIIPHPLVLALVDAAQTYRKDYKFLLQQAIMQ